MDWTKYCVEFCYKTIIDTIYGIYVKCGNITKMRKNRFIQL